jgi:hypothetical protein
MVLFSKQRNTMQYCFLMLSSTDLNDASELWLSSYTKDDSAFRPDLESLWGQMRPLYEKVHAYVRFRFRQHWGEDKVAVDEPMPAHIFGNMWAQQWHTTLKIVSPFPDVTNPLDEVNEALLAQVSGGLHADRRQHFLMIFIAELHETQHL